jgi:putative DNA primase/helicase
MKANVKKLIVKAKPAALVLDRTNPMEIARLIIQTKYKMGDHVILHRHRGAFWKYTGSYYQLADDEAINSDVWTFLEHAFTRGKGDSILPFKPTRASVGDVVAALVAASKLNDYIDAAAWLTKTDMPPANEFISLQNGLLHLPTKDLLPATPDYFCVNASQVAYDPKAPEPVKWLKYLNEVLGDDEAIQAVQEWNGYLLSPDTSQQKILFCIGTSARWQGNARQNSNSAARW